MRILLNILIFIFGYLNGILIMCCLQIKKGSDEND